MVDGYTESVGFRIELFILYSSMAGLIGLWFGLVTQTANIRGSTRRMLFKKNEWMNKADTKHIQQQQQQKRAEWKWFASKCCLNKSKCQA